MNKKLATSLIEETCIAESLMTDDHAEFEAPERSPVDLDRIRRAVREILHAVGEDPDREGLLETPDRVARMYAEVFSGLHTDPRIYLKKAFTQKYDEMVLVRRHRREGNQREPRPPPRSPVLPPEDPREAHVQRRRLVVGKVE